MQVGPKILRGVFLAALVFVVAGCTRKDAVDEATAAHKTVADFPETRVDLFQPMDGGVALTSDEIAGRNTWMLWTGGNEAFWDYMARHAYGLVDFLKTIDSRRRPERFATAGLLNEPGYRQATQADEFGLYIDQPISNTPDGSNPAVDGKSTGVIGFRLFPNPNFDEAARKKWDPRRYYTDPAYYQDPKLVTPYRVGMTCALCHVSLHPLNPPADTEAPEWKNLSATVGNQFFRTRGVFGGDLKPSDFLYWVLEDARPGTVETSIVATDNNNNPNIINAIYNLGARLGIHNVEQMGPAAAAFPPGGEMRNVPHVLVDGADSIGVTGALDRVFVNIGMFGEEWLRCHNPIIGVRTQQPFSIATARKHSVYWQATEARTPNLAKYLVAASRPTPLRDAPGGQAFLTADRPTLDRGRTVFAENCVSCHSSKRPDDGVERRPEDWGQWAHSEQFLTWARAAVLQPDFFDDNNYLSSDARYPITMLKTNAGRALQDNATRGKIWEQFSSETYKQTPAVGKIEVYEPFTDRYVGFNPPGGGPGFYRVPTLVSIWDSAPYLHNNALGDYTGDPSVAGRMRAFDSAVDTMFSLEKRRGPQTIDRTPQKTWFVLPAVYLPDAIEGIVGRVARPFTAMPWLLPAFVLLLGFWLVRLGVHRRRWARRTLVASGSLLIVLGLIIVPLNFFAAGKLGDLKLGPFPKGMPLNVVANINPAAPPLDLLWAMWELHVATRRIEKEHLSDAEATRVFNETAGPALWKVSKNPDWIEDRGHYFAVRLSDDDKHALKEFLKTL